MAWAEPAVHRALVVAPALPALVAAPALEEVRARPASGEVPASGEAPQGEDPQEEALQGEDPQEPSRGAVAVPACHQPVAVVLACLAAARAWRSTTHQHQGGAAGRAGHRAAVAAPACLGVGPGRRQGEVADRAAEVAQLAQCPRSTRHPAWGAAVRAARRPTDVAVASPTAG